MSQSRLWGCLAVGVALPRWMYLFAEWSGSLRMTAWAVDVVCLVAAAYALRRLQREVGDETTATSANIALAGFALDTVITIVEPWMPAPLLSTVGVCAWIYGTSSWLSNRCDVVGAPRILWRLAAVALIAHFLFALLRPEWPVFLITLVLRTGMAVQCFLIARAPPTRGTSSAP